MSHVHRRQFLTSGLLSLAELVTGGPLKGDAVTGPRGSIFDAHLHIPSDNGENFQWNLVTRNMDDFVRYLDRCQVKRGVISSSRSNVARTAEDFRAGNREVAKYADRYKRFRGSCVVTPFQIEEALREIEDCRRQLGFVWLGETCNYMTGYKYDSPEWTRIMELGQSLNYVMQIHTTTAEMRYLAERFPKATIVFPHLGPSRTEIFQRIEIVAKHPNTYLEISGSGVERVGILEKAVKEIGSERVLYGSDFTINEPSAVIARVKHAFLTAEERNNILFRNLEKLLQRAG